MRVSNAGPARGKKEATRKAGHRHKRSLSWDGALQLPKADMNAPSMARLFSHDHIPQRQTDGAQSARSGLPSSRTARMWDRGPAESSQTKSRSTPKSPYLPSFATAPTTNTRARTRTRKGVRPRSRSASSYAHHSGLQSVASDDGQQSGKRRQAAFKLPQNGHQTTTELAKRFPNMMPALVPRYREQQPDAGVDKQVTSDTQSPQQNSPTKVGWLTDSTPLPRVRKSPRKKQVPSALSPLSSHTTSSWTEAADSDSLDGRAPAQAATQASRDPRARLDKRDVSDIVAMGDDVCSGDGVKERGGTATSQIRLALVSDRESRKRVEKTVVPQRRKAQHTRTPLQSSLTGAGLNIAEFEATRQQTIAAARAMAAEKAEAEAVARFSKMLEEEIRLALVAGVTNYSIRKALGSSAPQTVVEVSAAYEAVRVLRKKAELIQEEERKLVELIKPMELDFNVQDMAQLDQCIASALQEGVHETSPGVQRARELLSRQRSEWQRNLDNVKAATITARVSGDEDPVIKAIESALSVGITEQDDAIRGARELCAQIIADRKLRALQMTAATNVQRVVRGWMVRLRIMAMHRAATRCQTHIRMMLAQRRRLELEAQKRQAHLMALYAAQQKQALETEQRHHAAGTIQSAVRMFTASRLFKLTQFLARTAQRVWHGFVGRRRARRQREWKTTRREAATTLQRIIRGHAVRVRTRKMLTAAVQIQCFWRKVDAICCLRRRKRADSAARTSQRVIRGMIGRKKAARTRAAVVRVQSFCRMTLVIVLVEHIRQQQTVRSAAAIDIQRIWRGRAVRSLVRCWHTNVVCLQATVRGHLARRRVASIRRREGASIDIQRLFRAWTVRSFVRTWHTSATVIQACIRGHWGRQKAHLRRIRLAEQQRKLQAATIIQSCCRRYSDRTRYVDMRSATIRVQSAWRRFKAGQELKRRRSQKAAKQQHIRETACTTKIQALWRGYRCRQRKQLETRSVITIQCCWRCMYARVTVKVRKAERAKAAHAVATAAAVVIQCFWRCIQAKAVCSEKRAACTRLMAAVTMQCFWRCIMAMATCSNRRIAVARRAAAVTIQCCWRSAKARAVCKGKRVAKELSERIRAEHAATVMQCAWRCMCARVELNDRAVASRQAAAARAQARADLAAVTIQCAWRSTHARMLMRTLKQEKAAHAASLTIQCSWRQRCARDVHNALKAEADLKAAQHAAVAIQCAWRCMQSRIAAHALHQQRVLAAESAAITIQCAWRCSCARKSVTLVRAQAAQATLTRNASIKIQCAWRMARAKTIYHRLKQQAAQQAALRAEEEAVATKEQKRVEQLQTLSDLCHAGDAAGVAQTIAEAGFDINECPELFIDPIRAAIEKDSADVISALLNHSMSFPTMLNDALPDSDGHPPLLEALRHGSIDVAEVLLSAKADAAVTADDGSTATEVVILEGTIDALRFLLSNGIADVDGDDGNTLMMLAAQEGQFQMLRELFHAAGDPPVAATNGSSVQSILEKHHGLALYQVGLPDEESLLDMAEDDAGDMVENIVKMKTNVDCKWCCVHNCQHSCSIYPTCAIGQTNDGMTPLTIACYFGGSPSRLTKNMVALLSCM